MLGSLVEVLGNYPKRLDFIWIPALTPEKKKKAAENCVVGSVREYFGCMGHELEGSESVIKGSLLESFEFFQAQSLLVP